jgi:hypothetical protein
MENISIEKTSPFFTAEIINGRKPWDSQHRRHYMEHNSSEQGIREIHRMWQRFMDEKFFHETKGALFVEGQPEGEDNPRWTGESGWYDCNGTLCFADEDFPENVDQWIERGITGWSYDNYVVAVYTSQAEPA